jgi:leucyl-tRNA synthetase
MGEIMKRTENVLHVDTGAETWRVVEILSDAVIEIPEIPGKNNVNQLKHHLEVQRMSKSKGNVVNPDELVAKYGADTVRAYLMFGFNWEKGGPWDSKGIQGVVRWIEDVWKIVNAGAPVGSGTEDGNRALIRKLHQTIRRVENSLEKFSFNTSVAALMELRNALQKAIREETINADTWDEVVSKMLLLMAPITPFVAEELWSRIGGAYSIHQQRFPAFDPELAAEDEITLVVQINGKVRDRIQVPAGISEANAKTTALESPVVQKFLEGREPRKMIYVEKTGILSIVI